MCKKYKSLEKEPLQTWNCSILFPFPFCNYVFQGYIIRTEKVRPQHFEKKYFRAMNILQAGKLLYMTKYGASNIEVTVVAFVHFDNYKKR